MAAETVGDLECLVLFLADEGHLEPVLVRQRMRHDAHGQRIERIDGPIGARRLAEHVGINQVGDPLGPLPPK